jgi:peptide/nickel transport system substrate-binding protein
MGALRGRVARGLLCLALVALGCGPAQPGTTTPVVRVAWPDAGVLTPFRVSTLGPDGLVLLSLVYDTLVWKDDQGLIPWLARSWDVSPDGLDYTLTLASPVSWQDDSPLTAEDVSFSFDYYAQHPFRWQSTNMVDSAIVLAPDQVRLHLKQPFAPFLDEVLATVPIIPRHVWANVADPEHYAGPDATLGSGPFKLAEYRSADAAYRFVANRSYFHGHVAVPEFQQLNVPAQSQVQALQQGQLELAMSTDGSIEDAFRDNPRVRVAETPPLSVVRLAINTERPPLDDKTVRQALAFAIDRAQLAQSITHDTPIVGSAGLIPPDTPWFDPSLPDYPFDPARARALLAGQTYRLELLADPTYREPELLAPMLQAVGITLDVKRVDSATRTQLLREKNFSLAEVQHLEVGGDPDFLRRWSLGTESNDFAQGWTYHDPWFDELAQEQAMVSDPDTRRELVFNLQAILADQLPTIALYYRRFYWAYDSSRFTPMNTWGGLMDGLPFVQNKLAFLSRGG